MKYKRPMEDIFLKTMSPIRRKCEKGDSIWVLNLTGLKLIGH